MIADCIFCNPSSSVPKEEGKCNTCEFPWTGHQLSLTEVQISWIQNLRNKTAESLMPELSQAALGIKHEPNSTSTVSESNEDNALRRLAKTFKEEPRTWQQFIFCVYDLLIEDDNFLRRVSLYVNEIQKEDDGEECLGQSQSRDPAPAPNPDLDPLSNPDLDPLSNSDPPPSWVSQYNTNLSALRTLVTQIEEVTETNESLNARRLRKQAAIFQKKPRGSYWIIYEGNSTYLVPKPGLKVNEHIYSSLSTLFTCIGYEKGAKNDFQLIQPANVLPISGGQEWQFQPSAHKPGELHFNLEQSNE